MMLSKLKESENERLWLKEADYRYQEYKKIKNVTK